MPWQHSKFIKYVVQSFGTIDTKVLYACAGLLFLEFNLYSKHSIVSWKKKTTNGGNYIKTIY
jgi:hypothetical protein